MANTTKKTEIAQAIAETTAQGISERTKLTIEQFGGRIQQKAAMRAIQEELDRPDAFEELTEFEQMEVEEEAADILIDLIDR